jgi:glycosyltransferase involved in cell wall biosynthesis
MRITVLTVCYNEEQIIKDFLDHYSGLGVSKIVVYDNKSTDNTVKICNEYGLTHQNVKVEVVEYDTNGQIRDDVYLDIKNHAWKNYKSDFYIVVDCDEFLEVPLKKDSDSDDRKRLVKYLATMKKGYVLPRVLGVQVVTDTFHELFDGGLSMNSDSKRCVFDDTFNKRCIFSRELVPTYRAGCHTFTVDPKDRAKLDASVLIEKQVPPLFLFHFKYVDREYVINRFREFKDRLSDFNKKNNYGHQYTMDEKAISFKFDYLKRYAITLKEVFSKG